MIHRLVSSWLTLVLVCALSVTVACSGSSEKKDDSNNKLVEGNTNASKVDDARAEKLFKQGNQLLDKRKWDAAVVLYTKAVEANPTRWDIYMNKAIAESNKPDFPAALQSMEKALRNGGDKEPVVYFNLGNVYQNRGLYAQAVKAYRAGLTKRDTPHLESMLNIAAAYIFLRRWEESRATYEKIKLMVPKDPRSYHGLALLLYLERKDKEAVEAYEQVHTIDPKFSQAYLNKGAALGRLKRYTEAAQSIQRYLDLDPNGPYVKRANNMVEYYRGEAQKTGK